MKRNQEEEIRRQEAIVHACDDMCLPDNLKNRLFQDVQEAKGKLIAIELEEQREGQELESFLNEYIQDDRIRYILNRHYIQQKSTDIEGDAIEADCKSRLWEIIDDVLNDKQKDVITSYYLNQRTFTEIAEETGVSRQRINQIKEKAVSILKEINELQDLAEFWGYDSMMAYTGRNRVEYLVLKKLEYEEKIQKKTAQFENTMLSITKNQQACIVERIEELCREKHISKRKLEMEAGLGTGSISKWNKFRPRKASIQRVADYFGVELEFLIGNSKQNQEEVS